MCITFKEQVHKLLLSVRLVKLYVCILYYLGRLENFREFSTLKKLATMAT